MLLHDKAQFASYANEILDFKCAKENAPVFHIKSSDGKAKPLANWNFF